MPTINPRLPSSSLALTAGIIGFATPLIGHSFSGRERLFVDVELGNVLEVAKRLSAALPKCCHVVRESLTWVKRHHGRHCDGSVDAVLGYGYLTETRHGSSHLTLINAGARPR
jgi:hypothetical protein